MGNRLRLLRARSLAAVVGTLLAVAMPLMRSVSAARAQPGPISLVGVVQTDAGLSQLLAAQPALPFSSVAPDGVPVIDVDDQARYQQFRGIGGAMTDSAAWLIYDQLAPADRLAVLQALFGGPGPQNPLGVPAIHLNFVRVAMGASGAMTVGAPYTYDDMPSGGSDPSLSQASIAHDLPYIIPALQQARAINPALEILANPWSPPAWMKTNDSLDNQGGQGALLSSAYGPLAQYFVDFIKAYAGQGVPVDAVTPQNEPRSRGSGTAYPGLTLPESAEEEFISQYLAPALSAAGLDTKIYGNDLSWDSFPYASALASGSAADELAGLAWHCYFGSPTVMTQVQQAAPGLDQIVDECSPELRGFGTPEFLISSLRSGASVASVWGLALDPQGGPIQPGNNCPGCTGLLIVDEQAHSVSFRTKYFQLGQVSAFVQPGAWRIGSPSFVAYGLNGSNIETVSPGLDDVAFLNPDGSKVLVAYNTSTAPISFAVRSGGRYFSYTIPPSAMTTFTWDGDAPESSGAPTISGLARDSQTLTAVHGTWSNDPAVYADQWLRCDATGAACTPIVGALGQTYTLSPDDVGSTIRVQEIAVNSGGGGAPATSVHSAVVLPPPPSSVTVPSIWGLAQQGQTLTEEHGTWSNNPTAYSYRWLRCDIAGAACTPIPGATAQSYELGARDVGKTIRVQETADNAGGTAAPATSAQTAFVVASTAGLQAVLVKVLVPPRGATKSEALLKHGGYEREFSAPVAGQLTIEWYYAPAGLKPTIRHAPPSAVLIATVDVRIASPGLIKVNVRLTSRGKQLLRRAAGQLIITAEGTYIQTTGPQATARRSFTVRH